MRVFSALRSEFAKRIRFATLRVAVLKPLGAYTGGLPPGTNVLPSKAP